MTPCNFLVRSPFEYNELLIIGGKIESSCVHRRVFPRRNWTPPDAHFSGLSFVPKSLIVKDPPQVPRAQPYLYWGIINREARSRHD
jgi:hypothetical protein